MVNKRQLRSRKRKVMSDLKHFRKMWACMWKDKKRWEEFWEYVRAYAEQEIEVL